MDEDTEQKKTSDVVNISSNIGIPVVHQCVSLYMQTVALCVTGLCLYEVYDNLSCFQIIWKGRAAVR